MQTTTTTGTLFSPIQLAFAAPAACLYGVSPFDPGCDLLVKEALGSSYETGKGAAEKNRARMTQWLDEAVTVAADALKHGALATPAELDVYQGLALYALAVEFGPMLQPHIEANEVEVPFWDEFEKRRLKYFKHAPVVVPGPEHMLSILDQMRRARHFAETKILGASRLAQAARAAIYRANLPSDLHAYAEGMYLRIDALPVLITGEPGSGKDLAAECIGWSRYRPFDKNARRFVAKYDADYHARSLCEFPRDLIERELFGHKKGAFTGADADAPGFFALARRHGTLFLDEASQIPLHVQAKLLRPLQNRVYFPLGGTTPVPIQGRLLFASNKDLESMCREGTFHADLHERMNGLHVHMPPLRAEEPEEIEARVRTLVAAQIRRPDKVEWWTAQVMASIPKGHPWRGNMRELVHYVERFLHNGHAGGAAGPAPEVGVAAAAASAAPAPATEGRVVSSAAVSSEERLWQMARAGELPAEEVMTVLVTRAAVNNDGNKAETARKLGIDKRTVARHIDPVRFLRWMKKKLVGDDLARGPHGAHHVRLPRQRDHLARVARRVEPGDPVPRPLIPPTPGRRGNLPERSLRRPSPSRWW
jgi:DNA-binding NtrC family response regulator